MFACAPSGTEIFHHSDFFFFFLSGHSTSVYHRNERSGVSYLSLLLQMLAKHFIFPEYVEPPNPSLVSLMERVTDVKIGTQSHHRHTVTS